MSETAILALFDLVMAIAKEEPQIIDSIARIKEKGLTDENIAAERASIAAIDTSDPLKRVPDPGASIPDPAAPGPVDRPGL